MVTQNRAFRRFRKALSRSNIENLRNLVGDLLTSGHFPGLHWGQDGEDVYLAEFLPPSGFYVDVGAHHPFRFSSTKLLYDRGWSGLDIDVTKAILDDFPRTRIRNQFHYGLVGESREAKFFRFYEAALSTLDEGRAQELMHMGRKLKSVESLDVTPLDKILESYDVPYKVDLLCVDAEGSDLEILQTINFKTREFSRILIEVHTPAWNVPSHPIDLFLTEKNYRPTAVWGRSVLYESIS